MLLPGPDHALMRPRDHLDVFGDVAVPGDRPVMRPVQPDQLGQYMRITPVALQPRRAMPFPIPRCLLRVHGVHGVSGGDQRLHPRTAVGLGS